MFGRSAPWISQDAGRVNTSEASMEKVYRVDGDWFALDVADGRYEARVHRTNPSAIEIMWRRKNRSGWSRVAEEVSGVVPLALMAYIVACEVR
jgi:hypothetical protein